MSACGRIQVIVDSSRRKHEFTHFVSIPIKVVKKSLHRVILYDFYRVFHLLETWVG